MTTEEYQEQVAKLIDKQLEEAHTCLIEIGLLVINSPETRKQTQPIANKINEYFRRYGLWRDFIEYTPDSKDDII